MNRLIILLLIIPLLLTGCNKTIKNNVETKDDNIKEINIVIKNEKHTIILENNKTTKELVKLLPLELGMNDLNNNEKYTYLDKRLPTDEYSPKQINKGDVMLFGDNCLVIFYKTFNTNYSYTKIGHINDLPELSTENITIVIEK